MSRFETEILTQEENVKGLALLNTWWVDRAKAQTSHQRVSLDMDSSESPVHGQQEGAAYNAHLRAPVDNGAIVRGAFRFPSSDS